MLHSENDSLRPTDDDRMSARLERRKALKILTAGGACCLLSSVATQAATKAAWMDHDSQLEEWTKRIGSRFEVRGLNGASFVRFVKLSEVIENSWIRERDPDRPSDMRPASISLVFTGPREIPSASYRLTVSPMNSQMVFLNPIGRHGCADGTAYEVILN